MPNTISEDYNAFLKSIEEDDKKIKKSTATPAFGTKTTSSPFSSKYGKGFKSFGSLKGYSEQDLLMDHLANQQRVSDQWGNALLKMTGRAATTFAETFTDVFVGLPTAASRGEFSGVYDHEVSRQLDEWNDKLEEMFPNYYTMARQNSPWYKDLGTANFWADKVFKNLGFTIGAIGGAMATAGIGAELMGLKAARAAYTSSKLAAAGDDAAKLGFKYIDDAGKIPKAIHNQAKNLRFKNRANMAQSSGLAANTEAGIEARHGKDLYLDNMIQDHISKTGQPPPQALIEEFKKEAESVGNAIYILNLPVLMASNLLQFNRLLSRNPRKNLIDLKRIVGEKSKAAFNKMPAKQAVKETFKLAKKTPIQRTNTVFKYMKNPLVEGVGEEGNQYAIETGARDYFKKIHDGESKGIVNDIIASTLEGFKQTWGSDEGQESMIIGAIIGGGFSMPGRVQKADGTGGFGFTGGIWDSIREDKILNQKTLDAIEFLNTGKSLEKIANLYKSSTAHKSHDNDYLDALGNNDEYRANKALFNDFNNMVTTSLKNGTYDVLVDKMHDIARTPADEFNDAFTTDPADSKVTGDTNLGTMQEMLAKADKIKTLWDDTTIRYPNLQGNYKDLFVHAAANIENLAEYRKKVKANIILTSEGVLTDEALQDIEKTGKLNLDPDEQKAYNNWKKSSGATATDVDEMLEEYKSVMSDHNDFVDLYNFLDKGISSPKYNQDAQEFVDAVEMLEKKAGKAKAAKLKKDREKETKSEVVEPVETGVKETKSDKKASSPSSKGETRSLANDDLTFSEIEAIEQEAKDKGELTTAMKEDIEFRRTLMFKEKALNDDRKFRKEFNEIKDIKDKKAFLKLREKDRATTLAESKAADKKYTKAFDAELAVQDLLIDYISTNITDAPKIAQQEEEIRGGLYGALDEDKVEDNDERKANFASTINTPDGINRKRAHRKKMMEQMDIVLTMFEEQGYDLTDDRAIFDAFKAMSIRHDEKGFTKKRFESFRRWYNAFLGMESDISYYEMIEQEISDNHDLTTPTRQQKGLRIAVDELNSIMLTPEQIKSLEEQGYTFEYDRVRKGNNILAYLSRAYETVTDHFNKKVERVDISDKLLRKLKVLDPKQLRPGTKIHLVAETKETFEEYTRDGVTYTFEGESQLSTPSSRPLTESEIRDRQGEQQIHIDNAVEISEFGDTYSDALDNILARQKELQLLLRAKEIEATKDRAISQYEKDELEAQSEYKEIRRLDVLIDRINNIYTSEPNDFNKSTREAIEYEESIYSEIGTKLKRVPKGIDYDNFPIAIYDETDTKIAHLHKVSWLNDHNTYDRAGRSNDIALLKQIRKRVIDTGRITTRVINKGNGKLIVAKDKKINFANIAFPSNTLKLTIVKGNDFFTGVNTAYSTKYPKTIVLNKVHEKELANGIVHAMLPVGFEEVTVKGKKETHQVVVAVPLQTANLRIKPDYMNSISAVLQAYFENDVDGALATNMIENKYLKDISSADDIANYIKNFIPLYNTFGKDIKEALREDKTLKEGNRVFHISRDTIAFSQYKGVGLHRADKQKDGTYVYKRANLNSYDTITKKEFFDAMHAHLANTYMRIDLGMMNKPGPYLVPTIKRDRITTERFRFNNYNNFVKAHTTTNLLSFNLSNDPANENWVYTIQPVVEFSNAFLDKPAPTKQTVPPIEEGKEIDKEGEPAKPSISRMYNFGRKSGRRAKFASQFETEIYRRLNLLQEDTGLPKPFPKTNKGYKQVLDKIVELKTTEPNLSFRVGRRPGEGGDRRIYYYVKFNGYRSGRRANFAAGLTAKPSETEVQYVLKVVNGLYRIPRNKYTVVKLQGWINDLKKHGVSDQQIEMFKDTAREGMTKEEIIASILADYTYTVEVDDTYSTSYSTLGMPGGMNYTNFEIRTPAINPIQKGHAEFSTNNGIGWVRADQENEVQTRDDVVGEIDDSREEGYVVNFRDSNGTHVASSLHTTRSEAEQVLRNGIEIDNKKAGQGTTMRVLELQSDLFQKNRKAKELAKLKKVDLIPIPTNFREFEKGDLLFDIDRNMQVEVVLYQPGYSSPPSFLEEENQPEPGYAEPSRLIVKYEDGSIDRLTQNVFGSWHNPTLDGAFNIMLKERFVKDNTIAAKRQAVIEQIQRNNEAIIANDPTKKHNAFLQLLNRDGTWINFFVKSIVQNAAKKGHKRILFPVGETAAKIEGHETIASEVARVQDRVDSNLKWIESPEDKLEELKGTLIDLQKAKEDNAAKVKELVQQVNALLANAKFKFQEPTYNIPGYTYGRIQHTDSPIRIGDHEAALPTDYKGYYIFAYNIGGNGSRTVRPISDAQAKEVWEKSDNYTKLDRDDIQEYTALTKTIKELTHEGAIVSARYNVDNFDTLLKSRQAELAHDLERLEHLKTEGLEKLKPIEAFYETRLQNVLKKIYGKKNINRITDKHGNKWFELNLKEEHAERFATFAKGITSKKIDYEALEKASGTLVISELGLDRQNDFIDMVLQKALKDITSGEVESIRASEIKKYWHGFVSDALDRSMEEAFDEGTEEFQLLLDNFDKLFNIVFARLTNMSGVKFKDLPYFDIIQFNDSSSSAENENWSTDFDMTKDTRQSMSGRMRAFFSNIQMLEKEGEAYAPVSSRYDIVEDVEIVDGEEVYKMKKEVTVLMSADEVFNTVTMMLVNKTDNSWVNFKNILADNIEAHPFLQDVIEKLEAADESLRNEFITTMRKHFMELTYVSIKRQGGTSKGQDVTRTHLMVLDSNRNEKSKAIVSDWNSGFKGSNLIDDNNTSENLVLDDIRTQNAIDALRDAYQEESKIEMGIALQEALSTIGINLSNDTIADLIANGLTGNKGTARVAFNDLWDEGGVVNYIIQSLESLIGEEIVINEINTLFKNGSVVALSKLEAKYTSNIQPITYTRGDNKVIYPYAENKFFTDRVLALQTDDELKDILAMIPFSKGSTWLAELMDEDSELRKYIRITYSDSITRMNSKQPGKYVAEMTKGEMELYRTSMFQNRGTTVKHGKDDVRLINLPYFTMGDGGIVFNFQTQGFDTVTNKKDIITDGTASDLFAILVQPEIDRMDQFEETGPTNNRSYNEGATQFLVIPALNKLDRKSDTFKAEAKAIITDMVTKLALQKVESWRTYGIVEKFKSQRQLIHPVYKGEVFELADNQYKYNVIDKHTHTNPILYAATDQVVNHLVGNMNMLQLIAGDPAQYFTGTAESTFDNISKRLSGDRGPGIFPVNSTKHNNMRVLVVKDLEVGTTQKYINQFGDYTKINVTDGQELTSLAEHLDTLVNIGRITDELRKDMLARGIDESLTEADINIIMGAVKPQYVSHRYNPDFNIEERFYIKSSSIPLVPQVTKHFSELHKITELVKKHNLDRVTFESAMKVGIPETSITIFEGENVKDNIEVKESDILVLPRDGFKIQQEIPYHEEGVITDSVQKRKMMFTNLLEVDGFNYGKKSNITGAALQKEMDDVYGKLFRHKKDILDSRIKDENGNIDHKKLETLLLNEALKRDFNPNEVEGLKLDTDDNNNFKLRLTFNPLGTRLESLLTSIVDNAIRRLRVRGESMVLVTEAGWRQLKGSDYQSTNFIPTQTWVDKPEDKKNLEASYVDDNGKLHYDQVIISSKFKKANGEYIDLSEKDAEGKYIWLTEEGTLNNVKVPEEILRAIGYRIPYQSLSSTGNIEIVGFLPREMGDIVIAPKEFVKRMGSDFDVDKLYMQMFNAVEINGVLHHKLHATSAEVQETAINNLEKNLERLTKRQGKDLRAMLDEFDFEMEDVMRDSEKAYLNSVDEMAIELLGKDKAKFKADQIEKNRAEVRNYIHQFRAAKQSYSHFLENEILAIQLAVLNNPKDEVQGLLHKPLPEKDENRLNAIGAEIEGWRKARQTNENTPSFIGISDAYQQEAYFKGKAGKQGVSVFSSDNAFNSTIQGKDIRYGHWTEDANGQPQFNEVQLTIGNMTGNVLSDAKTLYELYKSDVITWYQSSSVDNAKNPKLGELNVGEHTFSVIGVMNQYGFVEEVPYFISQDIIHEYISLIEANNSIINKYDANAKNKVIADLNNKYLELAKNDKTKKSPNELVATELTVEVMKDLIENGEKADNYATFQLGILNQFLTIDSLSVGISMLKSAIQPESKGVGKDMITALTQANKVYDAVKSDQFLNAGSLLGHVIPVRDYDQLEDIKKDEYVPIVPNAEYYLKPETLVGHSVVNGLIYNNEIWAKDFSDYSNRNIQAMFNRIIDITVDDANKLSVNARSEHMQTLWNEFRLYTYTAFYDDMFDTTMEEDRRELFFDAYGSNGQLLRASFGKKLTAILNTPYARSNAFLSNIKVDEGRSKEPTIVRYNSSSSDMINELDVNAAFLDMLQNDEPVDPNLNWSTREIALDFVKYAILSGNSIGFAGSYMKYIPFNLLEQMGLISKINNLNLVDESAIGMRKSKHHHIQSNFVNQYIQHNPARINEVDENLVKFDGKSIATVDEFTMPTNEKGEYPVFVRRFAINEKTLMEEPKVVPPEFFTVADNKQVKNFRLFKLTGININGTAKYTRISVLGKSNVYKEYNGKLNIANSSIGSSRVNMKSAAKPVAPVTEGSQIVPVKHDFTRKEVREDTDYLYLFTDNFNRTSGRNEVDPDSWYEKKYRTNSKYPARSQAVVRGLDNAYPITTMADPNRTQYIDAQLEEYKAIIDDEIAEIKKALKSGKYKGIKYGAQMPFGQGQFSKMKLNAPAIWKYLSGKLMELGIDNYGTTPAPIYNSIDEVIQDAPSGKPDAEPIHKITATNRMGLTSVNKLDKRSGKQKLADALDYIVHRSDNKVFSMLAMEFSKTMHIFDDTFEVIMDNTLTGIAEMRYDDKQSLTINPIAFENMLNPALREELILHEVLHAIVWSAEDASSSNPKIATALTRLNGIFNELPSLLDPKALAKIKKDSLRGAQLEEFVRDRDEFRTLLFTSKPFQELLQNTNYDTNKTIWSELMDRLIALLNELFDIKIKKGTALAEGLESILTIVTEVQGETQDIEHEEVTDIASFTNHSGGAYGADTYWDIIGREFGMVNNKHYRDTANPRVSQTLKKTGTKATILTSDQMAFARRELKRILGKNFPDTIQGNLQVRNYYQVVNADSVFAIVSGMADENGKAESEYRNKGVTGGTNTAVQLAIKLGKPVYVFSMGSYSWYKWNGEYFEQIDYTPTLTEDFAGIGTRDLENYNIKDKATGKWIPRIENFEKDRAEKTKQAIRDVYEATIISLNSIKGASFARLVNYNKRLSDEMVAADKYTSEASDKIEQLLGEAKYEEAAELADKHDQVLNDNIQRKHNVITGNLEIKTRRAKFAAEISEDEGKVLDVTQYFDFDVEDVAEPIPESVKDRARPIINERLVEKDEIYRILAKKRHFKQKLKVEADLSGDPIDAAAYKRTTEQTTNLIKRLNAIDKEIDHLKDVVVLDDVADIAHNDFKTIQNMLDKDIHIEDIFIMRKKIAIWKNASELILTPDELTNDELVYGNVLTGGNQVGWKTLEVQAQHFDDRVSAIENDFAVKLMEGELKLTNTEARDLLNLGSDISYGAAFALDISRTDKALMQAVYKRLKASSIRSKTEMRQLFSDVNDAIARVIPALRDKTGGTTFNIFRQIYLKTKKFTGNAVSNFSAEYLDAWEKMYTAIVDASPSDKNQKAIAMKKWQQKNQIIMDIRVLFPNENEPSEGELDTSDEARAAHIQELKDNLGELEFERMYAKLKEKMAEYDELYTDSMREINEDTELDEDNKYTQKQAWLIRYSPYVYLNDYHSTYGYGYNQPYKIVMRGHRSTFAIPLREVDGKDSGWYDPNFDVIMNDSRLYEFYNFFTDSMQELNAYAPNAIRNEMKFNTVPTLHKNMIEILTGLGIKSAFDSVYDDRVRAITGSDLNELAYSKIDVDTKRVERRLQVNLFQENKELIEREVVAKTAEFINKNGVKPTPSEVFDLRKEVMTELADNKSFDLGQILKAYGAMIISYKYKTEVEDILRISDNVVQRAKELRTNAEGGNIVNKWMKKLLPKPDSQDYVNLKKQWEYYVECFYGRTRALEGQTKRKILTKQEKALKKRLMKERDDLKKGLDTGKLASTDTEEVVGKIEDKLADLGKPLVWSEFGRDLLKWVHLKGMGWNMFSAFANLGFGLVSNLIEGAGGKYYTQDQIMKAYRYSMASVGKNFTFNSKVFPLANKIRGIMDSYNVLKDATEEIQRRTDMNNRRNMWAWLHPYNPQKRGEYINQSTIMMAILFNTPIKNKAGQEKSLWSAYSLKDGTWITEEFGPEIHYDELIEDTKFKIDDRVKWNHGNYDSDSSILMSKKFFTSALKQFRTWMFEGANARYSKDNPNYITKIPYRGRFVTLKRVFWDASVNPEYTAFDNIVFSLRQLLRKSISAVPGVNKPTQFEGRMDELDAENMRKLLSEFLIYLALISMTLLLTGDTGPDDDDKYAETGNRANRRLIQNKLVRNYLINQIARIATDVTFYFDPVSFEALLRNPVPLTKFVTDGYDIVNASFRAMKGDDTINSGFYAGRSRLVREVGQFFPGSSEWFKTMSASGQIYKK